MASIQDLLERYKNYTKNIEWQLGRGDDIANQNDVNAIEDWERWQGIGPSNLGGLSGLANAIKVSHGSPHKFERFDFSKIGTGEGAQAYGHGGYMAEGFDSPVAKEYRDKLTVGENYVDNELLNVYKPKHYLASILDQEGGIEGAKDYLEMMASRGGSPSIKNTAKEALTLLENGENPSLQYIKPEGHLYNASLEWPDAARELADPMGPQHFLDWDKPLNQQSQAIKEAIKNHAVLQGMEHYIPKGESVPVILNEGISGDTKGNEFYRWLSQGQPDQASDTLRWYGIPGIRYLDQGSRGAGQGTSNYVVFDENTPKIVSRNGVSLTDLLRRK